MRSLMAIAYFMYLGWAVRKYKIDELAWAKTVALFDGVIKRGARVYAAERTEIEAGHAAIETGHREAIDGG